MEKITTPVNEKKSGKSRRGFASMDKSRHKLVSSKGGKSPRSTFTGRSQDPGPSTNATSAG